MTVHLSIFAFACIFSFFASYAYRTSHNINTDTVPCKTISLFAALVSLSLLVFFVGMRTRFADTPAYITWFNETTTDFDDLKNIYEEDSEGIGFVFLMKVFKRFVSSDFNVFFMFLAIFQAFSIAKLYQKYSIDYAFTIFLFMTSTSYVWMMNGIRQFTAVCVILCFFDNVLDKKFLRFLLVVLIASTIHSSAIIWIVVYFIVRFKPFSWQIWVCVFATLIVIFFIDQFTTLLDSSLEGTAYEGTGEHLMSYTDASTGFTDDGVNPIRVLIAAVPSVIALCRRKRIEEISNPFIDVCINLSVATVGIYVLGVFTSGILVGRIPMYFMLTNYILLPWLIEKTFDGRTKTLIKFACILFYLLYFYYVMVLQGTAKYESSVLGIYQY